MDISTYIISYKGQLVLVNTSDADVNDALINSVPVYNHKMAIAYSGKGCLTGDIPTGLVKGNTIYTPSSYDVEIKAAMQNEKSGMVFEKIDLSGEDEAAIAEMRE